MEFLQSLKYQSAAAEAGKAVKGAKGMLAFVSMYNNNAAARFLQVFDSATLPADTAVPMFSIPVGIAGFVSLNLAPLGLLMQNGIAVCSSSTGATKTISAADALFVVAYG